MAVRRGGNVAALQKIQRPPLAHLIRERDAPDLGDVLWLLLKGLHKVLVVLEAAVVQGLDPVPPVHVLEFLPPLIPSMN